MSGRGHHEQAFTVLRKGGLVLHVGHPARGLPEPVAGAPQLTPYPVEPGASGTVEEVWNVLQQEKSGPICLRELTHKADDLEERPAARIVEAPTVAGLREALARKAGREDIDRLELIDGHGEIGHIPLKHGDVWEAVVKRGAGGRVGVGGPAQDEALPMHA